MYIKSKSIILKNMFLFILICSITVIWMMFLFYNDNKYQSRAEITAGGSSYISADVLNGDKPAFLIDGWKLYPDRLLFPTDLENDALESDIVSIGERSNLSAYHKDGSPYGYASWVMNLKTDGPATVLSIHLPEVLCSSKVYINGVWVGSTGDLDQGISRIEDATYSFLLDQETEILVQTFNNNHYYGGIYYPPLVGTPKVVTKIAALRMVFYGFFCFSSFALAIYSMSIWAGNYRYKQNKNVIQNQPRDPLYIYFGLLCLSFAIRVLYPFLRLAGTPSVSPLYAIENFSTLLGIFCAFSIACSLCGIQKNPIIKRFILPLTLGMCFVAVICPVFLIPMFPAILNVYGLFISWYKLGASLLLIILSFYGVAKGKSYSSWILAGSAACGTGLLINVLLINKFEPIYTGWQDEYSMFFMVLCFATMMIMRNRELIMENNVLTDHLEKEVEKKTAELTILLKERQKLVSEMLHDLKSPLTLLLTYVQMVTENDVLLDNKTKRQLGMIQEKCGDLTGRVAAIQEVTWDSRKNVYAKAICLNEVLQNFYRLNEKDAEAGGVSLRLHLCKQECWIHGREEDLNRMLENLVYNALSFTPENGVVTISLHKANDKLAEMIVSDTGCGIAPECINKIFDRFYTTRKEEGGRGMGLSIVKGIALEHGGTVAVTSILGEGAEFTVRLPINYEDTNQ